MSKSNRLPLPLSKQGKDTDHSTDSDSSTEASDSTSASETSDTSSEDSEVERSERSKLNNKPRQFFRKDSSSSFSESTDSSDDEPSHFDTSSESSPGPDTSSESESLEESDMSSELDSQTSSDTSSKSDSSSVADTSSESDSSLLSSESSMSDSSIEPKTSTKLAFLSESDTPSEPNSDSGDEGAKGKNKQSSATLDRKEAERVVSSKFNGTQGNEQNSKKRKLVENLKSHEKETMTKRKKPSLSSSRDDSSGDVIKALPAPPRKELSATFDGMDSERASDSKLHYSQGDEQDRKKRKLVANPKSHQLNKYLRGKDSDSDDDSSDSDPDVVDTYKLPIDRNYRQYRYFIRALYHRKQLIAKLESGLDPEEKEVKRICRDIYRSRVVKNHSWEILFAHLKTPATRKKILRDCKLIREDYDAKLTPINVDSISVRKYVRRRFASVEEMDKMTRSHDGLVRTLTLELKGKMRFRDRSNVSTLVKKYCSQTRLEMTIRRELIKYGVTSFDKIPVHQWEKDLACEAVKRLSKSEEVPDQTFNHAFNEVLIQMFKGSHTKERVQESTAPRSKTSDNRASSSRNTSPARQSRTTKNLSRSSKVVTSTPRSSVCPSPKVRLSRIPQQRAKQRNESSERSSGGDAKQTTSEKLEESSPSPSSLEASDEEQVDESKSKEPQSQSSKISEPVQSSNSKPRKGLLDPLSVRISQSSAKDPKLTSEARKKKKSKSSNRDESRSLQALPSRNVAQHSTNSDSSVDCYTIEDESEDDDCQIIGEIFSNGKPSAEEKYNPQMVVKDPPADDDSSSFESVPVKLEPPATVASRNGVNSDDNPFSHMYHKETTKDISFVIQNCVIKAHKFVLEAKCEAFYNAVVPLDGNNVEIEGVSANVFHAFIRYLYFDKIDEDSEEVAAGLLQLGVEYGLFRLKHESQKCLIKLINKSNAAKYLLKAHLLQADFVEDKAKSVVENNLTELQDTPAFKDLLKNPDLLEWVNAVTCKQE